MPTNSRLLQPVSMIVLTGGPCSGKSSSLAYLTEKLSDHGFMVFVVPETATLITGNGIDRRKMDKPGQIVVFEEAIFDMQMSFEDTYKQAVARIFPERRKVILLDRGIMDIRAFLTDEVFNGILKRKGLTRAAIRHRYDGVIHLVTAADGAAEYYTGENNSARLETPEEALRIDLRTQESWVGHPRFKIIDNSTDFQGKIKRTFSAIARLLGIPDVPPTREKYLVERIETNALPAHQRLDIEQVYLRSKDKREETRIRRRGQDGTYFHFLARTRPAGSQNVPVEEEELIPEQEYLSLTRLMDPRTEVLSKERMCFLWNNQYFELDSYNGRHKGLMMLLVESQEPREQERVQMPPFVAVGKCVTHDPRYTDKNLARRR
ncbi:MAG: AAA family ATPase [Syntrophorhabdaceae bacterium]|nr:AAA family ATPase [Syntrophorhabdaceae bacterium]